MKSISIGINMSMVSRFYLDIKNDISEERLNEILDELERDRLSLDDYIGALQDYGISLKEYPSIDTIIGSIDDNRTEIECDDIIYKDGDK